MSVVVAIDGPAGAGKGTLGRALAAELDLAYLDTGMLYRAVARQAIILGVDPDDASACTEIAAGLDVGQLDVDGLRTESVGQVASKVSSIPGVRAALFAFQRRFAEDPPDGRLGAVIDGRDIGTVICPEADFKIFLFADDVSRAKRRFHDAVAAGENVTLAQIAASIAERDARESSRTASPMRAASDAMLLDTSEITAAEVLDLAVSFLAPRLPASTFSLSDPDGSSCLPASPRR